MVADLIEGHGESHGLNWFPKCSMHKKPPGGFAKIQIAGLCPHRF